MSAQLVALHDDVTAARGGDRMAFERVVRATQGLASSIAFSHVRDRALSEDIVQEALLAVWRKLPQLRNPAAFLPWLREITRNLALSRMRAPLARAQTVSIDDFDELVAQAAEPADSLQQARESELLATMLDKLDADLREPLLLFYREGESTRQVAALLGLSDATIRKRLSRARSKLRADWLSRMGRLAVATAPTAATTGAVMTALTMTAPTASAAAAVTLASGVKSGALAGLGSALLAALAAASGGLLGVFGGVRGELRGIDDAQTRHAIVRSGWQLAAMVVIASIGIALATEAWQGVAAFGFLVIGLGYLAVWRMHRIRCAHALLAGPLSAQTRAHLRRRLWIGIAGYLGGGAMGGTGLWFGGRAAGWW